MMVFFGYKKGLDSIFGGELPSKPSASHFAHFNKGPSTGLTKIQLRIYIDYTYVVMRRRLNFEQ